VFFYPPKTGVSRGLLVGGGGGAEWNIFPPSDHSDKPTGRKLVQSVV
jgi:hypothetical protein